MNDRYTSTAIALHWLMALLLLALFSLGLYMADLPLSPLKLKLFSWHKWAGVTAFLLVLLRLVWRAAHRPPELPASMPPLMRAAAHAGHALLYLLMIAIPLSGWLMSSAKGIPTVYFGIWQLPDLLEKNKELGQQLTEVHEWLNWLLAATVVGHAAAAFKHQFVERDGILMRMLPHRNAST
jgi:cytochrome b561